MFHTECLTLTLPVNLTLDDVEGIGIGAAGHVARARPRSGPHGALAAMHHTMHDKIAAALAPDKGLRGSHGASRGLHNPMVSRHPLSDDTSRFLMKGSWRLMTPSKGKPVARPPAEGRDISKWNDIKFA